MLVKSFKKYKNGMILRIYIKYKYIFSIAELNWGRTDLNDLPIPGSLKESNIDDKIKVSVRINPFASHRQVFSMVQTNGVTVYRRLADMGHKNILF